MEEDMVTQVLSAPSVTRETEIGTLEVKLISKELFAELEKTGEVEYVCPINYGAGDVYCIVANLNSPVFISLKKK